MSYKTTIKDNRTGEIRVADHPTLIWDDHTEFWWTEGNYGCDCNRGAEFQRAGGVKEEHITWKCNDGDNRYTVISAELSDGTVVEID